MNAQTTNTSFRFWSAAEYQDTSSTNADNRRRCLSLLFLSASRAHAGTDVNINDRKDETQGAGTVADLLIREQNQLRPAEKEFFVVLLQQELFSTENTASKISGDRMAC